MNPMRWLRLRRAKEERKRRQFVRARTKIWEMYLTAPTPREARHILETIIALRLI